MNLITLIDIVRNKNNFITIDDYSSFCKNYLEFLIDGLQAIIVSRNENNYVFYQYKQEGNFNVTRPINTNLMLNADEFDDANNIFIYSLPRIKDIKNDLTLRNIINKFIYTCQQSIGATLDALPAGKSNLARKINGDLFERFIRKIIFDIGIDVRDGILKLPVKIDNEIQFYMSCQHDLIIQRDGSIKAVGSVKTSSKDRLDKIFIDKFTYNKLTNFEIPHFAIFLNDVQRKGREPNYGVNTTFLTGHFKAYTVKLNPLNGVYYCDIRPIMESDNLLKASIKTFDHLIVEDIWNF